MSQTRRQFLVSTTAVAALIGAARAQLPELKLRPTREATDAEWEHFRHFEPARRAKAHLLAPGERFLCPDDIPQWGDTYDGAGREQPVDALGRSFPRWWPLPCSESIDRDYWCYTPRGKRDPA